MDCRERKLSGNGVLSGVLYLDKCRSRNANSRDLEARANPTDERRERSLVAHTDRGEKVRIISARRATRQEKRFYEEGS